MANLPLSASGPVASIAEAIDRMEAVTAVLPEIDGVACFNRMYLTVTRQVGTRIGAGFFSDPAFMDRLDVVFVNLYLAALDGWVAGEGGVCRSWAALISRRARTDLAPLQFAIAGMNAHINHDLPLAVVSTCRQAGTDLGAGSHQADYQKVNDVLGELGPAIRQSFETGIIADLDRNCPGLENLVGNFSITAAREVAWDNACTLWHLGDNRFLSGPFLDSLDRMVAFAGRGLLTPLV
jgi:hypothetical protein